MGPVAVLFCFAWNAMKSNFSIKPLTTWKDYRNCCWAKLTEVKFSSFDWRSVFLLPLGGAAIPSPPFRVGLLGLLQWVVLHSSPAFGWCWFPKKKRTAPDQKRAGGKTPLPKRRRERSSTTNSGRGGKTAPPKEGERRQHHPKGGGFLPLSLLFSGGSMQSLPSFGGAASLLLLLGVVLLSPPFGAAAFHPFFCWVVLLGLHLLWMVLFFSIFFGCLLVWLFSTFRWWVDPKTKNSKRWPVNFLILLAFRFHFFSC